MNLSTAARGGAPVLLSPLTPDDVERVYELCQDEAIQRWTTVPSPYAMGDARFFVCDCCPLAWQQMADGTFSCDDEGPELVWGVSLDAKSSVPGLWGCVGLKRHGAGRLEIGWWLGSPVRGMGIMRAAAATVVETALAPQGPICASEIIWHAKVGNLASANIAARIGFTWAGVIETTWHDAPQPAWSAAIRAGDPIEPKDGWPELKGTD